MKKVVYDISGQWVKRWGVDFAYVVGFMKQNTMNITRIEEDKKKVEALKPDEKMQFYVWTIRCRLA